MLTKHALLSHSYGDDSKMALFVKIGPGGAEFLALQTDRDSRLLIQIIVITIFISVKTNYKPINKITTNCHTRIRKKNGGLKGLDLDRQNLALKSTIELAADTLWLSIQFTLDYQEE